jgi:HD superfamily phosphodiesterase
MKPIFEEIWRLAKPYLDTRKNDVHTEISIRFAYQLMEVEGGDENIVVPALILHDVGWKKVPQELHLKAFGPKATSPKINRTHEIEGVKIARGILANIKYDTKKAAQIVKIIDGHDSRKKAISIDERIVKDADKLWRYSKEGFGIDIERFEESYTEGLNRLRNHLTVWVFTETAKNLSKEELMKRENEAKI